MYLIAICAVAVVVLIFGLVRMRELRRKRELEEHSIEAEALHELIAKNEDILLFDVRQPLDLLAHSEIIPGAKRIPPKEVSGANLSDSQGARFSDLLHLRESEHEPDDPGEGAGPQLHED